MYNEIDRACSTYGERISVYRVFVGKPEGMSPGLDVRIILIWIFRKGEVGK
jgi:hypothetical protein